MPANRSDYYKRNKENPGSTKRTEYFDEEGRKIGYTKDGDELAGHKKAANQFDTRGEEYSTQGEKPVENE